MDCPPFQACSSSLSSQKGCVVVMRAQDWLAGNHECGKPSCRSKSHEPCRCSITALRLDSSSHMVVRVMSNIEVATSKRASNSAFLFSKYFSRLYSFGKASHIERNSSVKILWMLASLSSPYHLHKGTHVQSHSSVLAATRVGNSGACRKLSSVRNALLYWET